MFLGDARSDLQMLTGTTGVTDAELQKQLKKNLGRPQHRSLRNNLRSTMRESTVYVLDTLIPCKPPTIRKTRNPAGADLLPLGPAGPKICGTGHWGRAKPEFPPAIALVYQSRQRGQPISIAGASGGRGFCRSQPWPLSRNVSIQ
jgi:hypothetical protein